MEIFVKHQFALNNNVQFIFKRVFCIHSAIFGMQGGWVGEMVLQATPGGRTMFLYIIDIWVFETCF
jgi:hypothetical protein